MIHNSWFHVEANVKDDIFDATTMQKKKRKNVMDVSSFMLFEATGDSEADAVSSDDHHPMLCMADEDDAQSCSYDSFDRNPSADDVLNDLDDHGHHDDDDCGNDEEEDEEEEEECSSVYDHHQRWRSGENVGMPLMGGHQLKSTVSVDSTKEFELLNEVEKSRLFWETCLAS